MVNTLENFMQIRSITFTAALLIAINPALADDSITEAEIITAQNGWCNALVEISATNAKSGQAAAKALAESVIDSAYAYQMGPVLFKPTLTVNPQTFRTTREGALAYFVGGDPAYPNDTGFALNDWTACEEDNAAIFISGNTASTMGKVHFTDSEGNITTVDKTWQFVKDDEGQLRIVLHHSSLEHTAD
ncbi:hypothetical protein OAN12_05585 [Halioglobus sp.]|nr:hypothetical protein [Halioglobus sp.]